MKLKYTWTSGLAAWLLLAPLCNKIILLQNEPQVKTDIVFRPHQKLSVLSSPLPRNKTAPRESVRVIDGEKLKETGWYSTVGAEIARKSYYMAARGDSVSSINPKQGMQAVYRSSSFTLSALPEMRYSGKPQVEKIQDDWKLDLSFIGLYADGTPVIGPGASREITADTTQAFFKYDQNLTIQYQNSEEGTRQNFIIDNKPSTSTGELRVKLRINDAWVVNQASKDELHFALRDGGNRLNTKIIYKDLNAWDANGRVLAAEMQLGEGNDFSLVVAAADAVYPVTIDPLSTTASTTLYGSAGSYFGIAVASAGDVNGDGYSDAIVGAQGVSANSGAAYLYMGTATGLTTVAAKTLTGFANSYFGSAVSSAGDVNGDGYSDVVIGAYNYTSGAGAAFVYLGGAAGLSNTASVALTGSAGSNFGRSVSSAGDVNNDGYGDLIVGAPSYSASAGQVFLYKGTATGLLESPVQVLSGASSSAFGYCLSGAGDVNADGYGDIIVGASWVSKAFVYHGNVNGLPLTASTVITSPGFNDSFALSVAGAGDVNGDGYSDVIIGAYAGKAAYIYNGSAGGILATQPSVLSGSTGSNFGVSVASAGDINADGFADVIVGASGMNTYAGAAYVYLGSASGVSATASFTLNGSGYYGFFGSCVASAGDVNGDGFTDVIAGASGVSSNSGASYVYLGSPAALSSPYVSSVSGAYNFGTSLASAGDVNGDGYGDVVVAAPFASANQGYVWLYLGSATGLSTSASTVITSGVALDNFGYSLASAGDVNGDGYADVVVGTLGTAAYIYHGNAQGTLTLGRMLLNPGNEARFGFTVSGAGDVNADGYADVVVGSCTASKAYLYYGGPSGAAATASTILTGPSDINYGRSVAGIGDVNGDGYADVMVGACYEVSTQNFLERAFVYLGTATGISTTASSILASPSSNIRYFSSRITGAGDVNGDGYDDVLLGASGSYSNAGEAYLYRGGPNGISAISPPQTMLGAPGSGFGGSVSTGDFNRDGYNDLLIGAYSYNSSVGAAHVYLGGPTGAVFSATITGSGNNGFGKVVAGAGDVNGDGFSDMVVGTVSAGSIYTYMGNRGGQRTNRVKIYNSDLMAPISAANSYASNFGIGLFAKPVNGLTTVRLVWETEPNGTAFKSTTGRITNYTGYTSVGPWINLPTSGAELKTLIAKSGGRITKMRVRIQYKSTKMHAGQVFGPWVCLQNNKGILNRNAPSGRENAELFSPILAKIQEKPSGSVLTVYPNPATDILKLDMGDHTTWKDIRGIQVVNLQGQIVYSCATTTGGIVNVSALTPGIFIVKIFHQDGKVYHTKFMVKR